MAITQLNCPSCGKQLAPPAHRMFNAHSFAELVRRCDDCGIGYTNDRNEPTLVYREPERNLAPEVRAAAHGVVARGGNPGKRGSRWTHMGFSRSPDALLWTLGSWLAEHRPDLLARLGVQLFGLPGTRAQTVSTTFWGVAHPATPAANRLAAAWRDWIVGLDASGPVQPEPDWMIDYGAAGVVTVIVAPGAVQDTVLASERPALRRYVEGSPAFRDADAAVESAMWRLLAAWRITWEIAAGRPMRVVTLGEPALFHRKAELALFEQSLAVDATHVLQRLTWDEVLAQLVRVAGQLPDWLAGWLEQRGRRVDGGMN